MTEEQQNDWVIKVEEIEIPTKQTTEYNCGPTALSYFLALNGYTFSPSELEEELRPTPELGTDPRAIEQFLQDRQIDYRISDGRLRNPTLVNVNHELDGDHYMVITGFGSDGNLILWDPYYAEFKYWPREYFNMNWYSPLKGLKNWALYLT
jgi:predicted double-glycine peptidase